MIRSKGLVAQGITKSFGPVTAVAAVDLTVAPGEIVAVLGPSGCGKSTLLRVIAGLELPDAGTVEWDGVDTTRTPPHKRGFGLMFQDHALFPHRDVADNVAFGLRMQHIDGHDRARRTAEVLRLVGLDGYGPRRVATLSGGEAQRVALARALAPSPRLLMLDEPLGSLDRALRERLVVDIRQLLRNLGQAAVHVTHDQDEALRVADRLAVMRAGHILRDGPAADVWRDPRDAFVASFLGHDNVLSPAQARALGLGDGRAPVLLPEPALWLRADGRVEARVVQQAFRGARWRVEVRTRPHDIPLVLLVREPPGIGATVRVYIAEQNVAVLRDS